MWIIRFTILHLAKLNTLTFIFNLWPKRHDESYKENATYKYIHDENYLIKIILIEMQTILISHSLKE